MKSDKKNIISSIIFGIIALLLVVFLVYPLLKEIKKKSDNIISLNKNLSLFEGRNKDFEKIRKTYEERRPNLEKINNLFINSEAPVGLIRYWEKTAADSELLIDISPFSSLKGEKTDPWDSTGFQITLLGSFSGFLKFLKKIETSPYLIEINNLTVKKISGREFASEKYKHLSPDSVRANLAVKIYVKKKKAD